MSEKYRRLRYEDRKKIESLLRLGTSIPEMAKVVGVHRGTIYNELRRGGTPYNAEVAQRSL